MRSRHHSLATQSLGQGHVDIDAISSSAGADESEYDSDIPSHQLEPSTYYYEEAGETADVGTSHHLNGSMMINQVLAGAPRVDGKLLHYRYYYVLPGNHVTGRDSVTSNM